MFAVSVCENEYKEREKEEVLCGTFLSQENISDLKIFGVNSVWGGGGPATNLTSSAPPHTHTQNSSSTMVHARLHQFVEKCSGYIRIKKTHIKKTKTHTY